jgi:catechol 2,3-dioxygenase-like lactoylglutathione lyase family enzyme
MTAMMKGIRGAHAIIYSKDAVADRAFLRDVLGLPFVDAHDGWLIFGLPPSEVAVHPHEENDFHEFYFICDDAQKLVSDLRAKSVECTDPVDRGWGVLTQVTLPGGGKVGVYEPRHPRPTNPA